jgi:hypothetical protein
MATSGRKGRIALLGGALGASAGLGFFEQRYPAQAERIRTGAKLLTGLGFLFAIRGGKYSMHWAIMTLIIGVPEAKSFGKQLALRG